MFEVEAGQFIPYCTCGKGKCVCYVRVNSPTIQVVITLKVLIGIGITRVLCGVINLIEVKKLPRPHLFHDSQLVTLVSQIHNHNVILPLLMRVLVNDSTLITLELLMN